MVTKEKMRNGRLSLQVIKKTWYLTKAQDKKQHRYTQIIIREIEKRKKRYLQRYKGTKLLLIIVIK